MKSHSFVEIGHEIISTAILSLPLIQVGQSVSGTCEKDVHSVVLVNCLGLSLPRKIVTIST